MRSRYTAFVLRLGPYLLETWHPSTRPKSISFSPQQKWLGLKIVDHKSVGENSAEVEFIARYRIGGDSAARPLLRIPAPAAFGRPAQQLHERSRFLREDGRWRYVDGDIQA